MANFNKAFDKVVKAEGYYVNDPDDMGGETYLGITRKNHSKSKMWDVIDNVKKKYGTKNITNILKDNSEVNDIVKDIYKTQYWDVMSLDDISSDDIAHQLFDTAVNTGVSRAIKFAQKVFKMPQTGKFNKDLLECLKDYGKSN